MRLVPDGLAAKPVPYRTAAIALATRALNHRHAEALTDGTYGCMVVCVVDQGVLAVHLLVVAVGGNNPSSKTFCGILARHKGKANQET